MDDLHRRIAVAEQYLIMLDDYLQLKLPWERVYADPEFNNSVLAKYVLLHPSWLSSGTTQQVIQFGRSFGRLDLAEDDTCQAAELWGVACRRVESMEADHAFPYGLGGATESRNMLVLCKVHNRLKSGDIHFYDWPTQTPAWVTDALYRRRELI